MKLGLLRHPSMGGVPCPKGDNRSRGLTAKPNTTLSSGFALYHPEGQPLSLRSDRQRQVSRTLSMSQDLIPPCTRTHSCIPPQQGRPLVAATRSQVMQAAFRSMVRDTLNPACEHSN